MDSKLYKVGKLITDKDSLIRISEILRIMGDTTRTRIIDLLRIEELCVMDISSLLSMSQSAISHQLKVLKQAGLVSSRREGKEIYYALNDEHIKVIMDICLEHIREGTVADA